MDDLVLGAETKKLLLEIVRKWKEVMEKKGRRVNARKTKVMWCRMSKGQVEDFGEVSVVFAGRELVTIKTYVTYVQSVLLSS